jgi:transposase
MKKRQALLSEEQWAVLVPLFPEPKRRKDGRGRPWASNRACLQGILWVLRSGARWRDLPDEYPDGSTCWRRLRMWEEQGVWLRAWRKLLAQMDERKLLDWEEAFLDATFVTAKKGASPSARHVAGKVRSAWWWSTAGAYLSERNLRPRRSPNTGLRKARSNR